MPTLAMNQAFALNVALLMMVSEIEPYAGSIRVLVQSLIPESLLRLNKEQSLDQCLKFVS